MFKDLTRISFEKKIAVGLVIAIILLVGRGYVSYRSTNDLLDRQLRVAQTHQVRETIEHLLYQLEDIEDKQRLDLFTGENQFLESFHDANHKIDDVLHSLTALTSDDRTQQQHLLALRRLIDQRMTQLKETIELRNAGRLGLEVQRMRQHLGKQTMDQILMMLRAMREQEQALLITWSKQADGAAWYTYTFIIGGTLGTILLAIVAGWVLFYDLSKRRQAERDLHAGREREAFILRTMPIVIYSAKPSGDYGTLWVSENIETLTGYSLGSFLDDSSIWVSRLHPRDRERTLEEFARLPHEGAVALEYRWQIRSGEYRWFRDEAMLLGREDGTPHEIVGLRTDITARRHASELIRKQAEIINQIQETVIVTNMDGYVTSWNRGAENMLGYSVEEALGRHVSFIYPLDDEKFLEREVLAPVKAKGTHQVEVRRLTKAGALRVAQLSLTLLKDDTDSPIGIIGYSMDITDRKHGEELLLKSRNQLAALAVRLESVREEERARIALEVHDVLGQALTGLKLDMSWVYKQLVESHDSFEPSAVLSRLTTSLKLVDTTIQSVREIATTLRPSVLDQLGLEAAIEWQAQEFRRRTGIACETSISPDHIRVDAQQSTMLFRILQEVLTNVVRHAHATEVDIRLEETREHVIMQVKDNGKGITAAEQSGIQAFGLLGMRLRAQQQGGTFDIQGTLGKGTTITVKIPLLRTKR